jgi:NADPH:quinone reductase-like Zn-dependent oxidoreductase
MQSGPARPTATQARALYYTDEHRAALLNVALSSLTGADRSSVLVRTLWTGISRGTERLVFEGRVPESERGRMRAPFQEGEFPFPVKYGYQAVGIVEAGPKHLTGFAVFALHPHQDRFIVPADAVHIIPGDVPERRAILAANMETALNALWDSGASAGDTIVVIGAGVLGCLIAHLAARLPGADVTLVDIEPGRRAIANAMGAEFRSPEYAPKGARIVFHTSASEAGLRLALDIAGFEARIVEASWYGDREIMVPLGGAFHSQRLQLIASQVGHVASSHRARFSRKERLDKALAFLNDPRLDALITEEIAFDDLPAALPRVLAPGAPGIATAIRYP